MARKEQKIKVISQVYVGDKLTLVSDLNAEQKERLAVGLQVTYLNALFAGKAEFSPPSGFALGRDANGRITVARV